MRYILFFMLFWCGIGAFFAQQTTAIPSSYVAGNASVAYDMAWLPFGNPAALGRRSSMGVSIIYENRYITRELANKAINFWLPTKLINTGLCFSHFGYSEYNEMIASLSFGRQFGDNFSLGVDMIYYTVFLSPSERYKGVFTAQLGTQVDLTDEFSLALSVFNPVFSKIKGDYAEKRLPTIFSIGSLYKIRDVVNWLVQFDKEVSSPFRWATGFEYILVKELIVRVGAYGYDDFRPTLGAGLRLDSFKFDIAADYNSVLGFSVLGGMAYEF